MERPTKAGGVRSSQDANSTGRPSINRTKHGTANTLGTAPERSAGIVADLLGIAHQLPLDGPCTRDGAEEVAVAVALLIVDSEQRETARPSRTGGENAIIQGAIETNPDQHQPILQICVGNLVEKEMGGLDHASKGLPRPGGVSAGKREKATIVRCSNIERGSGENTTHRRSDKTGTIAYLSANIVKT